MTKIIVPFVRDLKPGAPLEKGNDVFAIQRALEHARVLQPHTFHQYLYAENTWDAVGRFQGMHGLDSSHVYGHETHRALAPHFDAYGRSLLLQMVAGEDAGSKVAHWAYWYYGEAGRMRYDEQLRPFLTWHDHIVPPHLPPWLDCSGLAITCYWLAGAADKIGRWNQGGAGNTFSLWPVGKHIPLSKCKPGDLVFHYSHCSHVGVFVGWSKSGEPMEIGFGRQGGPFYNPADYSLYDTGGWTVLH